MRNTTRNRERDIQKDGFATLHRYYHHSSNWQVIIDFNISINDLNKSFREFHLSRINVTYLSLCHNCNNCA